MKKNINIIKWIYVINFLIKHTKCVKLIYYYIYIIKYNNKLILHNYKNLINFRKTQVHSNKFLWKFLNKLYIYKFIHINYLLEINKSNIIIINKKNKYNQFVKLNSLLKIKNQLIINNKFKQKLIYKKYWYNWKLSKIKLIKYQKLFLWPLIIIIKPYLIIIKNIYFNKTYILKKQFNKFICLNLNNNLSGNLIWYILHKYINYKKLNVNNKINYNLITKNFKAIKKVKNNKIYVNYFYNQYKNNNHLNILIYKKLYLLLLLWFLYNFNKLYYYINKINNVLWINNYYFNNYLYVKQFINNNFYFNKLYKQLIFNKINKNYYFFSLKTFNNFYFINKNNKLYYIFNKICNYKNVEYNLIDLNNFNENYKIRNYYKHKYFNKKSFFIENKLLKF